MSLFEQIKRAGYLFKVQWECEFDDAGKPELLPHPIVLQSPLNTRDALYEGRTEAMRLHYMYETIQYVHAIILYPYICNNFKFPIRHPIIHVGDACKDKEL